MLLAINEINRNKFKFTMIALILGLIVFLLVMSSALGEGLLMGITGAIKNSQADLMILNKDAHADIERSRVPVTLGQDIAKIDGVLDTSPFGYIVTKVAAGQNSIDVALIGITKGTVGEPTIISGQKIDDDKSTVIVDESILRKGVKTGDILKAKDGGRELKVAGITSKSKLSMLPAVYIDNDIWQEIKISALLNDNMAHKKGILKSAEVNALLVKAKVGTDPVKLKNNIASSNGDIEVLTRDEVIKSWPGMGPMQLIIKALKIISYLIGIAVTGVFFYILIIQKTAQIGAIKAMGASSTYILKELIIQATIVTLVGSMVGLLITQLAIKMMPPAMLINSFDFSGAVLSILSVYIMSIVGSLFSLRHIIKIDPGIALGQAQ